MMLLAPVPPATRIAPFEKSAFCAKYKCAQADPIEPLRIGGAVTEYFYNYKAEPHSGQFGFRLERRGGKGSPYMIIRWYPENKILSRQDLTDVNLLVRELTGVQDIDAEEFVWKFAKEREAKPAYNYGPEVRTGKWKLQNSYSWGRKLQVTFMLSPTE